MPNHVYSSLTIGDTKEGVEYIKEKLKYDGMNSEDTNERYQSPLSFKNIIPMPPNIFRGAVSIAEEEKYGKENCWYDWSIQNWGTKWDAYGHSIDEVEIVTDSSALKFIDNKEPLYLITYEFQTAWSPVEKVVLKLSEDYSEALIRYTFIDEGGSFAGICFYKNGKCIQDNDITNNQKKINELIRGEALTPKKIIRQFKKLIREVL